MRSCYGIIIRRTAHHRIRTRARVPHSSEDQVIHHHTACDTTTYIHTSKNGKIYMHVMCILIPWKSGPHRDTFPTWFSGLRANIIHLKLDYKRHIYFILAYIHTYIDINLDCSNIRSTAESSMIVGDFPPSSSTYGGRCSAAARATILPTRVLPEKNIGSHQLYVCMYGVGRGRNANTDRWLSKEEVTEASPVEVKRSERNR